MKSFKEEVLFGLCSKDKQKLARQREVWRKFISQGTGLFVLVTPSISLGGFVCGVGAGVGLGALALGMWVSQMCTHIL